jgi:hypothetical protein
MKSSDKPRTPTKAERATREELYAEAAKRNIRGRSGMTKAQLQKALGR